MAETNPHPQFVSISLNTPLPEDRPDIKRFMQLMERLCNTFIQKTTDYGNSYRDSVLDIPAHKCVWVRAKDKIKRIENLLINHNTLVKTESVEDTLCDLSVYCILTLICLEALNPAMTPHPEDAIDYQ